MAGGPFDGVGEAGTQQFPVVAVDMSLPFNVFSGVVQVFGMFGMLGN